MGPLTVSVFAEMFVPTMCSTFNSVFLVATLNPLESYGSAGGANFMEMKVCMSLHQPLNHFSVIVFDCGQESITIFGDIITDIIIS